ncbi:amidase [Streptomyces sp. AK02-04a]|uniref:amidase n=1 Tax=Streptomyces sp. AK02-04a TaxID=3028649 RepID=UPI0029A9582C|nr:amidase [Streptomyces sp. AK02-04a]MDX3763974.1 amidase [Streptomyces sp. AK02-04a]
MTEELWGKDARELALLISSQEVSSVEVIESHLNRIDEVNPTLNAIVDTLRDRALDEARAADERTAAGASDLGALHGVPVTIKENIDVAGTATTNGAPASAHAIASQDAPAVERLRAAGAIILGRTNLPDMALRVHTYSSLRGLTRNPWHPGLTAGGSSGGEAAALASGMTPLGIGNDIGGSLRSPAHCCGVSSIKPTTGRVPHATVTAPEDGTLSLQMMQVNGVMARRVADLDLGLGLVAGVHHRDPGSVPVPLAFPELPTGVKRVALLAEPPGGATNTEIANIVRQAAKHLATAGYDVEEVTPPDYVTAIELWHQFLFTEIRAMRPLLDQVIGDDGRRFLDGALANEPVLDLTDYIDLFVHRRRVARAWLKFLRTYPVIVSPVWSQPAFPHGWDAETPAQAQAVMELLRPVMPANLLGLPAATTPAGRVAGMPVGVQCMAAPFREDVALSTAAVIEAAVGRFTPVEPFVNAVNDVESSRR